MVFIEFSRDFLDAILRLWRLLDHKVNRAYPPDFPTTEWLNGAIQRDVQYIYNDYGFANLGDAYFIAAYSKLNKIVDDFKIEPELSMEKRDELVLVMRDLFKAEGFREKAEAEGEWDAPILERELRRLEAEKARKKPSKVLSLGKVRGFLKHGN